MKDKEIDENDFSLIISKSKDYVQLSKIEEENFYKLISKDSQNKKYFNELKKRVIKLKDCVSNLKTQVLKHKRKQMIMHEFKETINSQIRNANDIQTNFELIEDKIVDKKKDTDLKNDENLPQQMQTQKKCIELKISTQITRQDEFVKSQENQNEKITCIEKAKTELEEFNLDAEKSLKSINQTELGKAIGKCDDSKSEINEWIDEQNGLVARLEENVRWGRGLFNRIRGLTWQMEQYLPRHEKNIQDYFFLKIITQRAHRLLSEDEKIDQHKIFMPKLDGKYLFVDKLDAGGQREKNTIFKNTYFYQREKQDIELIQTQHQLLGNGDEKQRWIYSSFVITFWQQHLLYKLKYNIPNLHLVSLKAEEHTTGQEVNTLRNIEDNDNLQFFQGEADLKRLVGSASAEILLKFKITRFGEPIAQPEGQDKDQGGTGMFLDRGGRVVVGEDPIEAENVTPRDDDEDL